MKKLKFVVAMEVDEKSMEAGLIPYIQQRILDALSTPREFAADVSVSCVKVEERARRLVFDEEELRLLERGETLEVALVVRETPTELSVFKVNVKAAE